MSQTWVILAYGCSGVLALLLLYLSGPRRWYWHLLSVLLALVIGLVPLPKSLNTPQGSLWIGVVFVFLFLWGAAAPFFLSRRRSY